MKRNRPFRRKSTAPGKYFPARAACHPEESMFAGGRCDRRIRCSRGAAGWSMRNSLHPPCCTGYPMDWVDKLEQWQQTGGTLRVIELSERHAVVDLCACTGEVMERW